MSRLYSFATIACLSLAAVALAFPTLAFIGYEAPLLHVLRELPTYQPDVSTSLLIAGLLTSLLFVASPSIGAMRSFWTRLTARSTDPVPIVG